MIVVALCACTHEPTPRAATDRSPYAQLEQRLPPTLAALGRLRDGVRAAGPDCSQVARTVRSFAADHAHMLDDVRTLYGRLDEKDRERFDYDHDEERGRFAELLQIARTCPDDADAMAAFKLAGLRGDSLAIP
jgi:hypothetical protein